MFNISNTKPEKCRMYVAKIKKTIFFSFTFKMDILTGRKKIDKLICLNLTKYI